jgi:cation diffusion facilitator CzcD-associated flavoprotein CzcO
VFEVVVIGAGQAGLTAAYWLQRRGLRPWRDFIVLDRNPGPGGAWRHRWPALTLGRAHGIHDLPGLPLGEVDSSTPASELVADYFERYEREFGLPVERPVRVDTVEPEGPGEDAPLIVRAGKRSWRTRIVISAAGTWTKPFVPHVPGIESFRGRQLRTVDFWDAEEFRGQLVAVVGGGLSAVQFILMLEQAGAETVWSTRRDPDWVDDPFDERWGVAVEQRVDARASAGLVPHSVVRNTGIPPWPEYLAARDRGRLVSDGPIARIRPDAVEFASGRVMPVDAILWATGFRADLDHLAPLRLREPGGGIKTRDVVEVVRDPRVLLVGYGASASTVGATRAGRHAALAALARIPARAPIQALAT